MGETLRLQMNIRVVDLSAPKIDGKFPLHKNQIADLAKESRVLWSKYQNPFRLEPNLIDPDQSMQLFHHQKEQFDNSQTVIAECRSLGLGDCFNNLKYALLIAEKNPDKQIIAVVTKPISEMTSLNVPSNVKLTTDYDEELLQDPRVFAIRFQLISSLQEFFATLRFFEGLLSKLSQLEAEGRYATYHNSLAYPWQNLASVLGVDPEATTYNAHDLVNVTRLQFLGIPVSEADIRRPIIKPVGDTALSYQYDLLIVPDAGENVQEGRSVKSLSAERWGKVFALLPQGIKIGIVMGHEHPSYTRKVLAEAMRQGLHVERIQTPTLEDFCKVVMQSRKFVGGDTGPTHIARDVIKAAHVTGREIIFRELFDEGRHPIRDYGTVGNGDSGKTLVANTKISLSPGQFGYDSDLSTIDAYTIAQFILH